MDELDPNDPKAQVMAQIETEVELVGMLQLLTSVRSHFVASDILTKIEFLEMKAHPEQIIRRELKEKLGE